MVPTLGITFTGAYEPIAEIAATLDELEKKTGLNIPIHVDAASGGFIAPFIQPDLKWDFRLDRVRSINIRRSLADSEKLCGSSPLAISG